MKKHLRTNHQLPEGSDRDLPVCGEHRQPEALRGRIPKVSCIGGLKPRPRRYSLDRTQAEPVLTGRRSL
jgi:hypothetical protein